MEKGWDAFWISFCSGKASELQITEPQLHTEVSVFHHANYMRDETSFPSYWSCSDYSDLQFFLLSFGGSSNFQALYTKREKKKKEKKKKEKKRKENQTIQHQTGESSCGGFRDAAAAAAAAALARGLGDALQRRPPVPASAAGGRRRAGAGAPVPVPLPVLRGGENISRR